MKTVFLDTMIYLHYLPIEQIDWPDVAGDRDVKIVVPMVTIEELDKHKNSSVERREKERAKSELRKLLDRFEGGQYEVRPSVTIELYSPYPDIDFQKHGLTPTSKDHVLVASMLHYHASHPDSDILLVTQDGTPRLVAGALGIRATALPEEWRSAVDIDAVERERIQLRKRVAELEKALPALALEFVTTTTRRLDVTRPSPLPELAAQVLRRIQRERGGRPHIDPSMAVPTPPREREQGAIASIEDLLSRPFVLTEDVRVNYNTELEQYFGACARFWAERRAFKNRLRRILRLRLALTNRGGAPGNNVDVDMHFPGGFTILGTDEEPSAPEKPLPPMPPGTTYAEAIRLGLLTQFDLPSALPLPSMTSLAAPPANVSSLHIRQTNSYDLHVHVRRVKHHSGVRLPVIQLEFDSFEAMTTFQISYILRADNFPAEIPGHMDVIISPGPR
jgi:hypothetical protein